MNDSNASISVIQYHHNTIENEISAILIVLEKFVFKILIRVFDEKNFKLQIINLCCGISDATSFRKFKFAVYGLIISL